MQFGKLMTTNRVCTLEPFALGRPVKYSLPISRKVLP